MMKFSGVSWWKYREGRITSSKFGLVLAAIKEKSYDPSLLESVPEEFEVEQQYVEHSGIPVQERAVFLSHSLLDIVTLGHSGDVL